MIDQLDHLVLTTANEDACVRFYVDVMGMTLETFGAGRKAFRFGHQKINLHVKGSEFEPRAHLPVPGALDLCFIAAIPLDAVIVRLNALQATKAPQDALTHVLDQAEGPSENARRERRRPRRSACTSARRWRRTAP